MKKATYTELVKRQQAQADKAYEIQTNIMLQQVTAEAVKVQQVEKEQQVKVQEAEILRREKELIATVLKGAEIDRQADRDAGRSRTAALDGGGGGPCQRNSRSGRGGSRDHLQEG